MDSFLEWIHLPEINPVKSDNFQDISNLHRQHTYLFRLTNSMIKLKCLKYSSRWEIYKMTFYKKTGRITAIIEKTFKSKSTLALQ